MPRPTDTQLNDAEDFIFAKMEDARIRTGVSSADEESVRRAAIVAHFAAALASLRSIQRGAK